MLHPDDTLEERQGPLLAAQAKPAAVEGVPAHAPLVILDVGKGLKGIKVGRR